MYYHVVTLKKLEEGEDGLGIVADNVTRFIKEQGLDPRAVAKRAGLDPAEFMKMLAGHKCILAGHVAPLAKALGKTPNELYGLLEGGAAELSYHDLP